MDPGALVLVAVALPFWYVAFVFSSTCHEAAHAWTANLGGDSTAYAGGQVTLDPRPHMRREPIGMIVIPLLSFFANHGQWMFGWASAPYNPYWARRHPQRAFAMSMAGPAANMTLAAAFVLALKLMLIAGLTPGVRGGFMPFIFGAGAGLAEKGFWDVAAGFCYLMVFLNTLLAVFNLLPVPPLDGFSVFRVILNDEQHWRLQAMAQRWWFMGLVAAWYLFPTVFAPVWGVIEAILDMPILSN